MVHSKEVNRVEPRAQKNLGIRLPIEKIAEVKAEAARRSITVSALFQEMWDKYRQGKR